MGMANSVRMGQRMQGKDRKGTSINEAINGSPNKAGKLQRGLEAQMCQKKVMNPQGRIPSANAAINGAG